MQQAYIKVITQNNEKEILKLQHSLLRYNWAKKKHLGRLLRRGLIHNQIGTREVLLNHIFACGIFLFPVIFQFYIFFFM